MAITASGLYALTFRDVMKDALGTTKFDLDNTAYKLVLINNSATPAFDTDASYVSGSGTYGGNETYTATYWPQGGKLISAAASGGGSANPTTTVVTGGFKYSLDPISVASTSLTAAHAVVIHADDISSPTAKPLICLVNFNGDYTTSNGTFGITWAGGGVFSIDLTP